MVAAAQRIAVDEFEQILERPENRERLLELIHGEIVEKMPTREHGMITINLGGDLERYLEANPVGQVAAEARHRPTGDRFNERLPDISVVLGNRPIERIGTADYIPELCVEIESPSDSPRDLLQKAQFYLANGARMVWLVYPDRRMVEVLTPDDRYFRAGDEALTGGDVLPGFTMPVSRLFRHLPPPQAPSG